MPQSQLVSIVYIKFLLCVLFLVKYPMILREIVDLLRHFTSCDFRSVSSPLFAPSIIIVSLLLVSAFEGLHRTWSKYIKLQTNFSLFILRMLLSPQSDIIISNLVEYYMIAHPSQHLYHFVDMLDLKGPIFAFI